MSVASPIPCIKTPNRTSSTPTTTTTTSSSFSSSSFRFSTSKSYILTIRSSQTEGPMRRPAPPSLREPSAPSLLKPTPPSSPVVPPPRPAPVALEDARVITMEFQRQKAKELQDYFKQKKLEEADQGPFFGFIGKNEIANGRWAMFGFAVGMLTEYATGSDFVDQVKILLSNFGILDLE
ncbi:hypothetical protein HS088_TW04G01197 [Tripterygium wilfordii]|uniref:One-helix protein 2 n=1 Tax=Tripterygium wilfordii TaxID=458696 RepID=A0A7J7DSF9_TRIWF|nr:light-harvesting complex-like protein OHP2, chloroplastic [Tripterygium wilfordii]KAF5749233.1 hypothetical protein HS088_TW04G01197 [Tripterygium wilfordii]